MTGLAEHPAGELRRLGQPGLVEVIGLVETANVATDSPAARPTRSRSSADTGGSAVSTNTAASIDRSASWAVSVSHSNTDPVPGVSTSSTPPASTGAARYTVTPAMPRRLPGFPRSVTRSARAASGRFSSCPASPTAALQPG